MTIQDMFAHKLCALGERATPRDIFDVGFFLKRQTAINAEIVKTRTGKTIEEYALDCAKTVRSANPKFLMQGLGEVLLDAKSKNYVRKSLIEETATALELFAMYPFCL